MRAAGDLPTGAGRHRPIAPAATGRAARSGPGTGSNAADPATGPGLAASMAGRRVWWTAASTAWRRACSPASSPVASRAGWRASCCPSASSRPWCSSASPGRSAGTRCRSCPRRRCLWASRRLCARPLGDAVLGRRHTGVTGPVRVARVGRRTVARRLPRAVAVGPAIGIPVMVTVVVAVIVPVVVPARSPVSTVGARPPRGTSRS